MKYILLLFFISIKVFSLDVIDETNNKEFTENNNDKVISQPEKENKKKNTSKTVATAQKEIEPINPENFIMPKAEDMGRVFVIPSLTFNSVFSGISGNFFILGSDFEFNTGLIYNNLAIYGNIGFGNIDQTYLLFHLEGGVKYNLPRLTRFMKPHIKSGLSVSSYFTSDKVYMISTISAGAGFKFFITDNFAFEESQGFQIGKEINENEFYMLMNFKLGFIFIF